MPSAATGNGRLTRHAAAMKNGTYPRRMTDPSDRDKAVPGICAATDAERGRLLYTLEVDGEIFEVQSPRWI